MTLTNILSNRLKNFSVTTFNLAVKFLSQKLFKTAIGLSLLFFISCNLGGSDFEGTWKSDIGNKIVITKVSDKTYDLKYYILNTESPNTRVSGAYTYNPDEKAITKSAYDPDDVNTVGAMYQFTYTNGKLYQAGDHGGAFYSKQ